MLQNLITELRATLVEYEIFVDEEGYAHNDEGETWYVGTEYGGTYPGGHGVPSSDKANAYGGRYGGYYGGRSKQPAAKPHDPHLKPKTDALQAALNKRHDKFLASILSQVSAGRPLSDKQKTVTRSILHKMGMHDESKLFK